jgi:hypothetical protein
VYEELASVRETIELSPQDALNSAQGFLTEQGYDVVHRTTTTLTMERTTPHSTAAQRDAAKLVITAIPLPEGGVRIKVSGNDREAVREQQSEWIAWSESLPKKGPQDPQGDREQYSGSAGGPEVLNNKLRELARQNMSDDENIQFCLVSPSELGGWSQAIVALDDRLLLIKPGLVAGATFGGRVTSFYYRDITGIEVNAGLLYGVIEINTSSYQGTTQKDFWSIGDRDKNPFKVTNALPIMKFGLKHYRPYIDRLRQMIRTAKQGEVMPPPQSSGSLSSELEKLASLRASGILTDEEFQQAKRRLLG